MKKPAPFIKGMTSKGAAMVEYIALVGLIGVISISVTLNLGETTRGAFDQTSDTLTEELNLTSGESSTPTSSGGGSGTPSGTPGSIPDQSSCFVLTNGLGQSAASYPSEPCFTYTAAINDEFTFAADDRPIYISGTNSGGPLPEITGDSNDNTTIVTNTGGGVEALINGAGGSDLFVVPDYTFAEATFGNFFGDEYTLDIDRGAVFVVFEGIEAVQFSDQTVTIGQIDACIADSSCGGDLGGPGGPGPGFGPDPLFVAAPDNCIDEFGTGELAWCPGPNPNPLPFPLVWAPVGSESCAFDPTYDGGVGQFVSFGGLPPLPGDTSQFVCQ